MEFWVPPDELDEDIAMSSASMTHTSLGCSASTSGEEPSPLLVELVELVGCSFVSPGIFRSQLFGGKFMGTNYILHQTKKKNTQTQEHNYIINLYLCTPFFSPTGRSFDVFFLNKNGSEQKPKEKVLSQPPPIKKKRSELQKKKLQGKEQTFPFNGTSWDALRMWKMKVCI